MNMYVLHTLTKTAAFSCKTSITNGNSVVITSSKTLLSHCLFETIINTRITDTGTEVGTEYMMSERLAVACCQSPVNKHTHISMLSATDVHTHC